MKFYNPFKAHVVQLSTGEYAIRKLYLLGWSYLDRDNHDDNWWYSLSLVIKYCLMKTEQESITRLNYYNRNKFIAKFISQ